MQVLVDRIEGDVAIARSASDAPEIDGVVRILGADGLKVGDSADVRITKAGAYDLEARLAHRSCVSLRRRGSIECRKRWRINGGNSGR